jgi:hypothetical protein
MHAPIVLTKSLVLRGDWRNTENNEVDTLLLFEELPEK